MLELNLGQDNPPGAKPGHAKTYKTRPDLSGLSEARLGDLGRAAPPAAEMGTVKQWLADVCSWLSVEGAQGSKYHVGFADCQMALMSCEI